MQSGFSAGHRCTSAMLKVQNDIITAIDKKTVLCSRLHRPGQGFWLCQSPYSLSADSTTLVSQMTALPGSPTTSQIEFSVFKIGRPVVWTSGLLYGGTTGFNSRADSFLCIYQWCRSCFGGFPDPPVRRRCHSEYFWPFFGHCVN